MTLEEKSQTSICESLVSYFVVFVLLPWNDWCEQDVVCNVVCARCGWFSFFIFIFKAKGLEPKLFSKLVGLIDAQGDLI